MADDKDKTKADEKAKVAKKFADKYESAEDLEKAYVELQKTLGTQGNELGTLKKQSEDYQRALQEYAQAMAQYKPVVEWYTTNQPHLQQYGQWLQQQNGRAAAPANAAASLLTPEEQRQLTALAVQEFQKSVFDPWRSQHEKQLSELADKRSTAVKGELDERLKAYTEVLWRTFQHALPKETVDNLRSWHEKSLRYADKTFDPMVAAREEIDLRAKLAELEAKNTEFSKQLEAKEKESALPIGRSESSVEWAKKPDSTPKDRDERYARVMQDTTEKSGREAVRDLFPGVSTR